MKNFKIGLVTSFKDLKKVINSFSFNLNYLSKHFDDIYIINSENLNFISSDKIDLDQEYMFKNLPKKVKLFNPKSKKEFTNFIGKNNFIIINSLGYSFSEIKTHYLLNKKNIKQIMISNVGNIQWATKSEPFRYIYYLIFKKFCRYFYLFLYGIGILKKISFRFVTNRDLYENFQKKIFSNISNMVLVNSKSFDILKLSNYSVQEDYIVFLNPDINHPEWIVKRGKIDEEKEKRIYCVFNKFLSQLSKYYNKKVIVCIHPLNDLNKIKSLLENFKIVQFQTPEYIKNAKLVVFADTSAIVDALILKKKIICMKEVRLEDFKLQFVPAYHNIGLYEIILEENNEINFDSVEKKLEKSKENYQAYNSRFSNPDGQEIGMNKIVNYIKNISFDN